VGFVLTWEQLSKEWARLDAFEGQAYRRAIAEVQLDGGSVVKAFIYQLSR
jgi:hypothetical protein